MSTSSLPPTNNESNNLPKWLTPVSFIIGVLNIMLILGLVVFIKYPTPAQYIIFRIILSLGGAAFSMPLTGFLTVRLSVKSKFNIIAGGALAVFVVLYFFSPKLLNEMTPFRLNSVEETVNFKKWKPFVNKNDKSSPVEREIKYIIEATGKDQRNFEDVAGTTNLEVGLDIDLLSNGASYKEDGVSQIPPRRTYTITLPRQSFSNNGNGELHYKVTYWNVFILNKVTSVNNPYTDITKYIRHPVEVYKIKCLFKQDLTYKKVIRSLIHEGNKSDAVYKNNNRSLVYEDKIENLSPGDVVTYYFDMI